MTDIISGVGCVLGAMVLGTWAAVRHYRCQQPHRQEQLLLRAIRDHLATE